MGKPSKSLIGCGIIFIALALVMGYIWGFLHTYEYFKITEIMGRNGSLQEFSYLKEKNIFGLDLRREAKRILEFYPECSKINLVRVLPNRIFVHFIKRKTLALVKLYKDFNVDEEGVFFYASGEPQEQVLPNIVGLKRNIFGAKPGRRYIKELAPALNIIREFGKNKSLGNYRIRKIDLANPTNISVFVYSPFDYSMAKTSVEKEAFEVKLGEDKIKEKISLLAGIITAEKKNISNIKYIDLRFKEPVIKFKDAK